MIIIEKPDDDEGSELEISTRNEAEIDTQTQTEIQMLELSQVTAQGFDGPRI